MPSHKRVLIAQGGGASLLQEGVVSDVSLDGIGILTAAAVPVGSSLEIEFVQPSDSPSEPLFLRGRVVHAKSLHDGTFALGVETLLTPNVKAVAPHAQVSFRATSSPIDIASPPDVIPSHLPTRKDSKRKRVAPVILVLLIPLVVGWMAADKWHGVKGATREESPGRVPVVPGKAKLDVRKHLEREAPEEPKTGMRARNLQSPSLTEDPDIGRSSARRGAPYALAKSSDAVLDDAKSASGRRDLEAVPIARPRPELPRAASTDTPRHADSALPARMTGHSPPLPAGLPTSGVAIAIDKDTFSLTLYRDGEPLRTIPIAVGENDTTPLGLFTVANKLTDPVWHNRGEGVPPGDPRNPLGKRWLGLAQNGRPTVYGIHGAVDPSRVGTPFGDGCLRLHPDDLETVFRLCPVGAVVLISP